MTKLESHSVPGSAAVTAKGGSCFSVSVSKALERTCRSGREIPDFILNIPVQPLQFIRRIRECWEID